MEFNRIFDRVLKLNDAVIRGEDINDLLEDVNVGEIKNQAVLIEQEVNKAQKDNQIIFKQKFKLESKLFTFLLLQHVQTVLIFADNFISNPGSKTQIILSASLFNHATNTFITIAKLTKTGFDYQARILLRNYIELLDLSVLIMADEDFFNKYKIVPSNDNEAKKKWFKATKPAKITQRIQKFLSENLSDVDYCKIVNQIRQDYYSDTSKFVHGDILTTPLIIDTDVYDKSNGFIAFGKVTKSIEDTLFSTITYSNVMFKAFMIAIVGIQKIPLGEFGRDGLILTYLLKTNEYLFKTYLTTKTQQ